MTRGDTVQPVINNSHIFDDTNSISDNNLTYHYQQTRDFDTYDFDTLKIVTGSNLENKSSISRHR